MNELNDEEMSVNLIVRPEVSGISWEEFLKYGLPFSAALDGYVNTGPRFDNSKVMVNFNHHEDVDRLATRATCAQVLIALRQGFFKRFRSVHGAKLNVYVNDCDEDICTSWFLLNNHYMATPTINPLLNKLVAMEDALDATAGAYPFPADLPALQELAWIFEPYRNFRLNGGLEKRKASAFKSIITDVGYRIMAYLMGRGNKIPLDLRYDIIHSESNWSMVKEIGANARTGMFSDGIGAYVSVKERTDGKWTYTLGKLSPFIPFDLLALTKVFNEEDNISDTDKWGGGNNIMGSPRNSGSNINPEQLIKIIKEYK